MRAQVQVKVIGFKQSSRETPRYRVWHAQNIPNNMTYYAVESPKEARRLIRLLSDRDLADSNVATNAFGLEELEDGEYHEWYDENGNDIMADED